MLAGKVVLRVCVLCSVREERSFAGQAAPTYKTIRTTAGRAERPVPAGKVVSQGLALCSASVGRNFAGRLVPISRVIRTTAARVEMLVLRGFCVQLDSAQILVLPI